MKQVNAIVEIGTSKIVCIIAGNKRANSIDILGTGIVAYAGIKKQEWVDPDGLKDAILEAVELAEQQAKRKIKNVFVGLPGSFINVITNSSKIFIGENNGKITQDDIEFLSTEAQKVFIPERMEILHGCPLWFELDDKRREISPVGLYSRVLTGMFSFILCEKFIVKDLKSIFDELKIHVVEFIATPLAQSLFLVPEQDRDDVSVLIDMGFYATDVSIVQGDGLLRHHTIDIGGFNFTNDLCLVKGIPYSEAEQIKRRYVFGVETWQFAYPKKETASNFKSADSVPEQEIMEARALEMLQLIEATLKMWKFKLHPDTKTFLSGGGIAMMKGSKEVFKSYFKCNINVPQMQTAKLNTPNLFSAYGMMEFINKNSGFLDKEPENNTKNKLIKKIVDFFTE